MKSADYASSQYMPNFSLIVSIKLLDPYPVTIAHTLSSVQSPFHWPTVDNNVLFRLYNYAKFKAVKKHGINVDLSSPPSCLLSQNRAEQNYCELDCLAIKQTHNLSLFVRNAKMRIAVFFVAWDNEFG
jgi:hypothetical protein